MKRSNAIILTLAGVSLGVMGYQHWSQAEPSTSHSTAVLPPEKLDPAMRASLPPFVPGEDVSNQTPPHNAYDPDLGYYHEPCKAWFPYPYDHYDTQWGYYRCGQWSRYHSTHVYPVGSPFYRPFGGMGMANMSSFGADSPTSVPPGKDYSSQPAGAPVHTGVPHSQASVTRSAFTTRGGFGKTGSFSGFFSGS